jgi:citrate synthase
MDRIHQLACTLTANSTATEQKKEHLTITDNRSGKTIEVPLSRSRESHFIAATALGKLKDAQGQPLRVYDPGYMNTICCVYYHIYRLT